MKDVSIFDHTADVGIEVSADTPEHLFELTLLGMTDLVVSIDSIKATEERTLAVQGSDDGAMLVALLSDALYLIDAEGFVACKASVSFSGGGIQARLRGERIEASRHAVKTEIKAVTYHMLLVERNPPRARVIFDI